MSGVKFDSIEVLSGGTMTGTLNITQSSTADTIKLTRGDVNQNNMIKFRSSSADKWIVGQRNDSTEHFRFYSYGTSSDVLSILTDGKVGIGTTTPDTKLHVFKATAGSITDYSNNALIVENSGDVGISFHTPNANAGHLMFGSPGHQYHSYIRGQYGASTTSTLKFFTDQVNTMTHKAGKVGIGTDSPDDTLHVNASGGTARLRIGSGNDAYYTSKGYLGDTWYFGSGETGDVVTSTISGGAFTSSNAGGAFVWKTDNSGTLSEKMRITSDGLVGIGITNPLQNLVVGTTTNYDPPGLGNTNANFAILRNNPGDYGIITGISSDGNVWSQVQRTDGTATSYNYYLQPSGGSVGVGVPQNYTYLPNLTSALHVAKTRSGTGNVTDYLAKLSLEALGYAGSNYQLAAIDFNGGDTAGAHNGYARIGCSSMNGANNQESGSLEFYVKDPSYNLSGYAAAMKICGKAGTQIAGAGQHRNGVLFPFMGIALDRTWSNYPGIAVGNSSDYSTTASANSEFRIHGANFSSASYPGTSGSDFSVNVRTDGTFISTSDRRAKTNITTITDALSKVKQLTGKRFQRINRSNEPQEHLSKNGYKFGFIAQEIEDIIPETVVYHKDEDDETENWNSSYAMDYGSVVALLTNAIKEQDTVIQDLKSRIETLEG